MVLPIGDPNDSTTSSLRYRLLQSLPGPQQVLKALTGSLGIPSLSGSTIDSPQNTFQHCAQPELSCQTRYHGQDTCCFNYPSGQFLQSQFWDADPAIGPEDSWTIHGLWPDYCNGGFDQYCDNSRRYSNISLILIDSGRGDLLDEMRRYWKDFRGDDANLWEHEWNKHGTCISTLETHCYDSDYYPQQEVVDYFDKTVEVFSGLPTYKTLADVGIVPSYEKTYTRREIQDALSKAHGAEVSIRCRHNALNEAWYYFNIAGSMQTGNFVPSDPDGQKSNCPARGIRYQPKTPRKGTPTKGPSEPTGPSTPFTGRGNLVVSTLGQRRGCLISRGTWFTSGTCATFRVKKTSAGEDTSFTLQSSKGACAFEDDVFSCGPHVTSATEFTADDNKLSYGGNTTFFADKAPKGPVQSIVFASEADHPIQLEISWKEGY